MTVEEAPPAYRPASATSATAISYDPKTQTCYRQTVSGFRESYPSPLRGNRLSNSLQSPRVIKGIIAPQHQRSS